jgi:hypothetical protein
MIAAQIRYPDDDHDKSSSPKGLQGDVHIASFKIGRIDAPLLGLWVPSAGNRRFA